MAVYTSGTSDIRKSKVLRSWTIGALGTLGFHYYAVGKIKKGIGRTLIGILGWAVLIALASDTDIRAHETWPLPVIALLAILMIPAIVDLIRILLGVFRDNVGSPVRE